jgi:acyl carrier protein
VPRDPEIAMNAAIETRVLDIVAAQSGRDRTTVTVESTLQDLQVDSLEAIEIVFEIEEAFGVQLADDDARPGTDSLQHLVDAVEAALAQNASAAPAA